MAPPVHIGPARANAHAAAGRGFSLLELIVVLALLGIMTAAVVPIYAGSLEFVRSDHAVREIIALIRYAQERAIIDVAEYRLYIQPREGAYWLAREQYDADGRRLFAELDETVGRAVHLAPKVAFLEPNARTDIEFRTPTYCVAFYPNASSDFAVITLLRDDGRTFEIAVGGALGRIEVSEQ